MKTIFSYISKYFYETDKRFLAFVTLLTGILVYLNYSCGVDKWISNEPLFITRFFARYLIFLIAFGLPYIVWNIWLRQHKIDYRSFISLVIIAPAIFSLKAGLAFSFILTNDADNNEFWNQVLYWPLLLIIVFALIYVCWWTWNRQVPFYTNNKAGMNWKPYWLMLLIMLPLIVAASTQEDFLAVYPKLKLLMNETGFASLSWWKSVLFELSYGSDFIGIELFFRGFLVIAFIKWAGSSAILPMACFYCTIHFGKPLGECISSYFGGLLLGIVVYNTRSIWGGLMVHLGIAWLMELGGYLGNSWMH